MAIDNNKLYNLKGSQVKNLAERIQSVDKIEIDTAAYPSDKPWVKLEDYDAGNYFWMQLNQKDAAGDILRLEDGGGALVDIPTIYYVDGKLAKKEDAFDIFETQTNYPYADMKAACQRNRILVKTKNGPTHFPVIETTCMDQSKTAILTCSWGAAGATINHIWVDGVYDRSEVNRPVPNGGTTGQALVKKSNSNQDLEWADVSVEVDNVMSDTSENAVQNKVIKNYIDGKVGVNLAVGKETWYGTYTDENNVTYQVYTKTVYIPALPSSAGITTYPIGVSGMKQIISISGVTTDGFVLNAPRQTVSDNITIYQTSKGSQTFSIEVGKDRSSKSAYVTIVYAKNN